MTSSATSPDTSAPLLVLCGAENLLHIVLGQEGAVLHAETIHCPGASVTVLAPAIARILAAHRIATTNLGGIAAVCGPGSFTGLRITLATVAGLGMGAQIPMAGLELHRLLAAQVPCPGRLWVATYARAHMVYAQRFEHGRPTRPVRPLSHQEFRAHVEAQPGLAVGSGIRRLELPDTVTALPTLFDTPWPGTLMAAAATAAFHRHPPAPLYLRPSDAEENLPAIAQARGLSEAEARRHIPEFVDLPPLS
ncbi:MAG: peptidase glycoprotease [Desulfomicrobiaceae bacterium]|jgi:tRNA threonylcarbamoyl adenosine modification protein YeaZ|nr:peptidase glycoprotease [Desulfomicrobiaceae bacterium]HCF05508.1 tRNA (adenosine(37)-N6)-threonylcarbamoyltransferase complex dimerization subunit type 1 TsaB [Desulfomicrobiaceae bacterium]